MTTFFIGDTHFGHKNIINFESVRPFRQFSTIEEHDEELVRRWNSVVRRGDTVWHLGDFAFGSKHIAQAARLNGAKKLVLGNHDHYPSAEYLKYFDKLYGAATFENMLLTHIPVALEQLERFGINIHGHLHANKMADPRYVNVSAEQINLMPIAFEELKKISAIDDSKKPEISELHG